MVANERRPHLLAYDISNPRRLYRVAKISTTWGLRVQYSIFILWITPAQRDKIIAEIESEINPATDDIRIYPLPKKAEWTHIGRAPLATGATLYTRGEYQLGKQELSDIQNNPEPPFQAIDYEA